MDSHQDSLTHRLFCNRHPASELGRNIWNSVLYNTIWYISIQSRSTVSLLAVALLQQFGGWKRAKKKKKATTVASLRARQTSSSAPQMHDIADCRGCTESAQTDSNFATRHLLNGYLHAAGAERHRLEEYTYLELWVWMCTIHWYLMTNYFVFCLFCSVPLNKHAYILSTGCQTRARPRLFQTIICLIVSLMTLQAHTGYTLRARYGSDDLTPGNTLPVLRREYSHPQILASNQ